MRELAHEGAFRKYLGNTLSGERLVSDCISRCRRVERCEGSLLNHFNVNSGSLLLNRLEYSATDERSGTQQRHSIPIRGKIRTGTASCKEAVNRYFDFLKQQG